jgi:hypothetical protein
MSGKDVFNVSLALLVGGTLAVVAYRLGKGEAEPGPEAVQRAVGERFRSLDGIEARLLRLEEGLAAVRRAAPGERPAAGEGAVIAPEERWSAVEASISGLDLRLKGLEEDPVQRGYSFITSENAELRREGVNILARVARLDPEARAALRGLLADPSPRVREQAAQKLAQLEDKESAAAMATLLGDTDPLTRRRAVEGLGAAGARESARDLGRSLLSDADDRVRQTAADVLGRLGSEEAREFLVEALKDKNDAVRGEAIASLGEIGATSAAPQLRALYDQDPGNHRTRLVIALKSLGDEAPLRIEVTRLSEIIHSGGDDDLRQRAIRDLVAIDRSGAQAILTEALNDPSPRVRREAERALR